MHDKRNIKKNKVRSRKLTILFLSLKNLGFIRFVPFVLLNFLFPLLLIIIKFGSSDTDILMIHLLRIEQTLVPISLIWNMVFVFREYVESEGNEILFNKKYFSVFYVDLLIFAFEFINVLILMIPCEILLTGFFSEIVRILAATTFLFGISLFCIGLFKSVIVAVAVDTLYVIVNLSLIDENIKIMMYMSNSLLNSCDFTLLVFPFLAGIILGTVGYLVYKRRPRFC